MLTNVSICVATDGLERYALRVGQRATDQVLLLLGRPPAVLVGFAFYALIVSAALLLGKGAKEGVGLGLLAMAVIYCFVRPHGGWPVWGWLMLPGVVATLMEIVGAPRWIGVLFIPVTLLGLWFEDRETSASASRAARAP